MGKNDPRDVCNNPGGKERLSWGRRQKPQSGWTEPRADSRVDSLIWKMKTICWEGACPSDSLCPLPSSTTHPPTLLSAPPASFTCFWTPSQWAPAECAPGCLVLFTPCCVWAMFLCGVGSTLVSCSRPRCGHATAYTPSVLGWTWLPVGTVTGKAAMGTDASVFLLLFLNFHCSTVALWCVIFCCAAKTNQLYVPLFWVSFPFKSPQSTEWNSVCYTVSSHKLSILYIVSIVYIC